MKVAILGVGREGPQGASRDHRGPDQRRRRVARGFRGEGAQRDTRGHGRGGADRRRRGRHRHADRHPRRADPSRARSPPSGVLREADRARSRCDEDRRRARREDRRARPDRIPAPVRRRIPGSSQARPGRRARHGLQLSDDELRCATSARHIHRDVGRTVRRPAHPRLRHDALDLRRRGRGALCDRVDARVPAVREVGRCRDVGCRAQASRRDRRSARGLSTQ